MICIHTWTGEKIVLKTVVVATCGHCGVPYNVYHRELG